MSNDFKCGPCAACGKYHIGPCPSYIKNHTTTPHVGKTMHLRTICPECNGDRFLTEQDYWDQQHCPYCNGTGKTMHESMIQVQDRKTFGLTLNQLGLVGLGAEIGVAYGENAEYILDHWKGSGIFLVDPYNREACGEYIDGSSVIDFDGAWDYMQNKLKLHKTRTLALRMTSDLAAPLIGNHTLDFVYIDGNHHNPQFQRDLDTWYPKVKPGGILGGHDYYDRDTPEYRCEVKATVDAFIKTVPYTNFYTTECSSWWLHKDT